MELFHFSNRSILKHHFICTHSAMHRFNIVPEIYFYFEMIPSSEFVYSDQNRLRVKSCFYFHGEYKYAKRCSLQFDGNVDGDLISIALQQTRERDGGCFTIREVCFTEGF